MNYLWGWLRCYEKFARNKILPSNALLCQLMYHYDLDQHIMINTAMLLCWGLPLYKTHHLLYVVKHEVWNVHHMYPCKMHQQMDMVHIKTGESALTTEIPNDEFHQRCKLIIQVLERKNSAQVPHIPRFDVWLIVGFL